MNEQTTNLTLAEKEQIAAKYASLLDISPEVVKSLIGTKIRGSATINGDGAFSFTPSVDTGPRSQRVATTRHGSYINRSLLNGQYSMTVKAPLNATDPAADIVDESLTLLKKISSQQTKMKQTGRILYKDDIISLCTDYSTCSIYAEIKCNIENTHDYAGLIVSQIGRVLSVLAQNKDKITRMKKNFNKNKRND